MNKVKNAVPEILLVISAVLIIGAIYFWAPVCSGLLELKSGKLVHMKCHYSAVTSVLLAIIMLVVAFESFLTKKKSFLLLPVIIGIMLLIILKDGPLSLGMCKMDTMACQKTKIWINLSGILAVISGLSAFFLERRNRVKPPQLD